MKLPRIIDVDIEDIPDDTNQLLSLCSHIANCKFVDVSAGTQFRYLPCTFAGKTVYKLQLASEYVPPVWHTTN